MFWRGVLGYLPVNIVQGVVGLLSIVIFTRILSPADYGVYALAFSAMSLAQTGLFVWLEASMARFYVRELEAGRLPGHFATLYRCYAVLSLAFPVAAAGVVWLWPMPNALRLAVIAGLATTPIRSLVKLSQERRRAAGDVAGAARLDVIQTAVGFLAGAGLAWLGLGGASPLLGTGIVAGVLLVWVLPTDLPRARGGRFEPARARMYAAYGLPVALSLILALVLATTDRFLIAAYLDETSVGVYHAGYSLASRTLDVVFIWLGMAGGPAAIAALERGGRLALHEVAREQSAFMVALTLPAAIGLALVARPLAGLMIGPGLREGAAQVTPWIAAAAFFAGINTHYLHTAFTLARHTGRLMLAIAIPAGLNLVLNIALVPRYGLQGALWATLASYIVGVGVSFALGRRSVALPVSWTMLTRTLIAAGGMAGAVSLAPAVGGVVELIGKALLGVLVYALLAYGLDVCGARTHSARLLQAMRTRAA
jgi:O-antigen/teichoic acid export membrane protein